MKEDWKERTLLLLGEDKVKKLNNSHVLIVGLGGVGAYVAEELARAGIGEMTIVDSDKVHESNRNRQLLALISTNNKDKVLLMQNRLLDINPQIKLTVINEFLKEDRIKELLQNHFDYVVDAIDTLIPKTQLIFRSLESGLRIVSSMGAGGKTDPSFVKIADISESHDDKLARMLRKRLHRLGVYTGVKVVFSPEKIDPSAVIISEGEQYKLTTVGTISYMPAIFGLYISSVVIRDLIG